MKPKSQFNILGRALGAAILVCTAGLASAQTSNTVITFSVDMTGSPNFILGTDNIYVRGTFNGYGEYMLTNNATGANPYLFSGTLTDTADANGGQAQYKFFNSDSSSVGWENTVNGNNRATLLPTTSGASLVLPTAFFSDDGPYTNCTVTFEVDMAQQINKGAFDTNADTVEVQGYFEGWSSGDTLTNDPTILRTNSFGLVTSNVYVGTFVTAGNTGSPGQSENYKFVIQPGGHYENPAAVNVDGTGNRFFPLINLTNPIVFYADAPFAPVATNAVTFRVDMTEQTIIGGFVPSEDQVWVEGNFNGWQNGATSGNQLTNDIDADNTNIYSGVVVITDGVGVDEQYKFTYTGGNVSGGIDWENPGPNTPQIGGNRYFAQPNATNTMLPVVYFSDTPPETGVGTPTEVTFTVNMANASEYGNAGVTFNPSTDSVYLNGDFIGWPSWSTADLPQMTNNPVGSTYYSIIYLIPEGNVLLLTYKYGMYNQAANSGQGNSSALDDEAGFAQNHSRYVRTFGNYTLPTDTFGNQFGEPIPFGQLSVGSVSGGTVPISWLGLPGVHLQTSTNLSGAHWVDHPETDGSSWTTGYLTNDGFVSVTNYPAGPSSMFFRLVQPAIQ